MVEKVLLSSLFVLHILPFAGPPAAGSVNDVFSCFPSNNNNNNNNDDGREQRVIWVSSSTITIKTTTAVCVAVTRHQGAAVTLSHRFSGKCCRTTVMLTPCVLTHTHTHTWGWG